MTNSPTTPTTPTSATTLLSKPLVIQFHISAVEGLSTHPRPKVKRSRLVHVVGEGSRTISDRTDPVKEDQSKWDQNLPQIDPLAPEDKFTFHVEMQPLLGRSTIIASTDPYTVDSLLGMQEQAPDENIKLPLNSQVKGNEHAILILEVRRPSSQAIAVWEATRALEDRQRRLLNGKDRALEVPATIKE